jgi:solute carrier family 13 (sodium-dependent dicarboxylate transporter), member 2/3/5
MQARPGPNVAMTSDVQSASNARLSVLARRGAPMLCVIIPIMIWFAPVPADAITRHALAIAAFMVLAWITEPVDHAISGLIGCFLFWALDVVRFGVAFSGFADSTPWFLFGAMLIGAMAVKSGLARRLAYLVMTRIGVTYSRILLGLIITDFVLTLIVPSGIARIIIMAAIALGLIEAFQAPSGSNVARGMFLIITYCAALFDKMIIAGASSITARGLIERTGGVEVQWSQWFVAFLPCDVITIVAAWMLTLWLFPPEPIDGDGGRAYLQDQLGKLGPLTAAECKAALLIGVATVLWMSDFIHHISPAKIGLGIGLLTLLPFVGVLKADDLKGLNYLAMFFVATALSMGTVLGATKGLEAVTSVVFGWMQPLMTTALASTVVLYWTAFAYHIVLSSDIAMLSTSVPLLMDFAKTHGFNPLMFGMIWTFASAGKIFVYQSAVLIVGYSYGFFTTRDLLRMGLLLTLVEFVAVVLTVTLYWPLIGIQ